MAGCRRDEVDELVQYRAFSGIKSYVTSIRDLIEELTERYLGYIVDMVNSFLSFFRRCSFANTNMIGVRKKKRKKRKKNTNIGHKVI